MRSGIMLAHPFEEKRYAKWNSPHSIAQPKLDGERCRAIFSPDGRVQLFSSECNLITSVPHINEQLENLKLKEIELDGELYVHGKDFDQIHSIVSRKVNEHYNSQIMDFHVFDIVTQDPQYIRLRVLDSMNIMSDNIKVVQHDAVTDIQSIIETLEEYNGEGYEGIILRHPLAPYLRKRSPYMMKFKPKKSDIYRIIGFQEEISKYNYAKDSLGAFVLAGDDGTEFRVGSGFTEEQRKTFWQNREDMIGKWCEVQYQNITTKGRVPRFPIFIRIVEDLLK